MTCIVGRYLSIVGTELVDNSNRFFPFFNISISQQLNVFSATDMERWTRRQNDLECRSCRCREWKRRGGGKGGIYWRSRRYNTKLADTFEVPRSNKSQSCSIEQAFEGISDQVFRRRRRSLDRSAASSFTQNRRVSLAYPFSDLM